jgi:hypothetical protein
MTGQTVKHDRDKPDYALLTKDMLEPMVRALMFGERKYSRFNYKAGFKNVRLTAAALRHIMAYNAGEDNDPESGVSHLAHAMVALGMLLDNQANGVMEEGRYVPDQTISRT